MKKLLLAGLLATSLASSAVADVTLESRNGMTSLHSEGSVIARYLSENKLTYSNEDFDFTLLGNIYGTQNWERRVHQEDGWLEVDAVRFEYGADLKYKVSDNWSLYTRHTMPVDRHDASEGDGWTRMSYRWDSGVIYKYTW